MINDNNSEARLNRLRAMRLDILNCKMENPELEWGDMLERANQMVAEEQHRLGYMAVYPIKDGSAQEAIYEGSPKQCDIYVELLLEHHPEMKENIIVLNI